jgi:hypothetical protein
LRQFFLEGLMPEQNMPNDASRKSKAEGDRANDSGNAGMGEAGRDAIDTEAGGITNRPLDEEIENQAALPDRGESKAGAHAGRGSSDDDRRSER